MKELNTRFSGNVWYTQDKYKGNVEGTNVSDLNTGHLLNIVKMLRQQPMLAQVMMIQDIGYGTNSHSYYHDNDSEHRANLNFLTSFTSREQLLDFVFSSPLLKAIKSELTSRGVNVGCYIKLLDDVSGNTQRTQNGFHQSKEDNSVPNYF